MSDNIDVNYEPAPGELYAFEEKANEIFEAFVKSMQGDERFARPPEEDEKSWAEEEGFDCIYTQEGSRLIDRMLDRLSGLAVKKFGAWAIDINIESSLYREA